MKTYPPVRMSEQGDLIDAKTYSDWCLQSVNTTYQQIATDTALVMPFTLKPHPRWRRDDCLAKLQARDLVVHQRAAKVRKQLKAVSKPQPMAVGA